MWLIFGGQGWIGQQLVKVLAETNVNFELTLMRLDDTDGVRRLLETLRPERVVCLVGRTQGGTCTTIDYLEKGRPQLVENVRDNLYAPVSCAMLCRDLGIHFTYLGTGCIFEYDSNHSIENDIGFTENDTPNFQGSAYSIVKGFTDRLMHLLESTVLQLRIRMPINEDMTATRNFLRKITTYSKVCSIPNSMTVLPDLLPIMVKLIQDGRTGTYNMTNPGKISHNEILDMYKTIVDPTFTYENFSVEEQRKVLLADRSNNQLDTHKLENEFFILPIYQSVQRLLKKIRKNQLLESNWSPRCVLVTGGCGFIGSNFLHWLHTTNPQLELINIDAMSYCSRHEHIAALPVTHYALNLNDTDKVIDILSVHGVDTIVHFAAQSHVDNSFNNSMCFTDDNVRGTHSLLEATRRYGRIQRFLHVSTDEVYGENTSNDLFTETTAPQPTNPYAATKVAAEFLVQSYFHCFEIPVIIIRGNNVYGPRQYPEKVIPKFICALLSGEKCTIHGNGYTRRNFMFVSDMCEAVLTVLRRGQLNEIYNVGVDGDAEHTVLDVVRTLVRQIYHTDTDLSRHMVFGPDRFYNDFTYRINSDKLRALGWRPVISFSEGIQMTIDYFRYNKDLFAT